MMKSRHQDRGREGSTPPRALDVGAALFLSMFAAQASVLVLSPILTDVAETFGVSTAVAGQLRTVSGLAAGVTALALTSVGRRVDLRTLIAAGLALLGVGAAASAVAPSFAALLAAQVVAGLGLAAVLSGSVAAATVWPAAPDRAAVLSWTLNGQPTAWVAGLPLIGIVAALSWRLTWVAVPSAAAVAALLVLRRLRPAAGRRDTGPVAIATVLRRPSVSRWALGELFAYAAWSGTLVFAGALFVESYGVSPTGAALILGAAALAYVPGNLLARRVFDGSSPVPLAALASLAAVGVAVFGGFRSSWWLSATIFAALAFVGGARGFAGSIRGMLLAPDAHVAVGGVRAAATQFGYLIGSGVGGMALAAGGYPGLAVALSTLFALATVPHLTSRGVSRAVARPVAVDPRACG